jgi:hypothetical protein
LEDALKQYTDEAVGSVDLSDYPTKTRYQIWRIMEQKKKFQI